MWDEGKDSMRHFYRFFTLSATLLFLGCSSNTPNSVECITAFDCEDGYTCQNEKCVALPDDVVVVDKDVAVTDGATDDLSDDIITDEELPPDEEEADEATDTDEDTPVTIDDPIDNDEDTFLPDDDLLADTTPPTVAETTPAAEATGVGIATTVEILFSEPMNETTLTTTTLILEQGETAINGTVSYDGDTFVATFTPDASLAYGTLYTFTVTTGAEDAAGNGLAVDHVFSFTTAAEEVNECVTMANPCNDHGDSGGSCVDTVGGYTCICSSGFGFSGGGCKDLNECAPDNKGPCDDNGDTAATCTNTSGSYTCTCVTAGYEFTSGSCRDINECLTLNNPCDNGGDTGATCNNTPGDYTCSCSNGWHDNGTTCDPTDECETLNDPCDNDGDTGATCQDGLDTYTCTCSDGWNFDDGVTCAETDECVKLNNPCNDQGDMGATCNDGMATYTCTCSSHYSWNFETCVPDTQTHICSGAPANSLYYNNLTSYSYGQTWNGSGWTPPASTATYSATPAVNTCQFKCAAHYTWNGTDTCTADTQPYSCAPKPATGTVWNTVSQYTQTWNGTGWSPADDPTTEYNTDPSDTSCRYKCAANYDWNSTACVNARTEACTNLPANAVYYNNTTSYSIPQTYTDGGGWQPFAIAYYDDGTPDINTCEYKCAPNYQWNGSTCVNARTQPCGTPPSNTVYYNGMTSYSIPQTYTDATGWQPSTTPYYDDGVLIANTCEYKCAPNYARHNGACVNSRSGQLCTGIPANAIYANGENTYAISQTYTDATGWQPPLTAYYDDGTPNANTCEFRCADSYHWDGSACVSDYRTYTCAAKPEPGTVWNTVSNYAQTWVSGAWSPVNSTTAYNPTPSDTACRYKCAANYEWSGTACINSRTQACSGAPSNTVYYGNATSYSVNQTYTDATGWQPPTTAYYDDGVLVANTCEYKCAANYQWNGSACINSRTQACSGAPSNTVYYNNSTSYNITQSYTDGSGWQPPTTAYYDATPDNNTCGYKCAANYYWTGTACINSRSQACSGIIANAMYYNNATSYTITQNYTDGSGWQPPTTATYNATPTENTCQFKCSDTYHWDGVSACVSNTRTFTCSGAPGNTVYYSGTSSYSYTQTWSGSWNPPDSAASYNATPTQYTCQYKCAANYFWTGSACINSRTNQSCTGLPTNAVYYGNATSYSITQSYTDGGGWQPPTTAYYDDGTPNSGTCEFKCANNYNWTGSVCEPATKTNDCTGAPTNTVYYSGTSSYSYAQTWGGSDWVPPNSSPYYDATPDLNTCGYKCAANYYWNSSACINTRSQSCTGLPSNAVYYGDAASYSIPQTYTDATGWQPPTTAYYDATPDLNTCGFKCKTHYTWNGSTTCVADTQPATCTGLPANAEWNTVSSITQTWNGSAWAPTTTGVYNATPSTTECRFKCSAGNSWNGSACVAPYCGDGISGNSTIPAFTEGFESGSLPGYASGDEWSIATDQKHAGTYSLKSDEVYWSGDYRSVYFLKYTDGQICFWHRSDGSIWYGTFRVYVDGSSKYSKSSTQSSWTEECISVSAGYRMVEFRFSINSDSGWGENWYIDDIRFYNATTEQCDGGSTTCGNLGFDCGSGVSCGSDCTWQAGEADCHDDGGCGC